jgi:hypothetical protein
VENPAQYRWFENVDPVRGPMDEGGLYGERGFGASERAFNSSSPMDGVLKAGVRFSVANFHLNMDNDLDAHIGVSLSQPHESCSWLMRYVFAHPLRCHILIVSIRGIRASLRSADKVPYSSRHHQQPWTEHAGSKYIGTD